ncbi:SdrD B-like domain-containing protein [Clostridium tarantellae]|uniref:DUF11 domain-containing protein n=1 Tax=Clostridium tarantellae TaxID=39493 RepID=A0A6I1MLC0_9CLOT|nr:SdrD B-like domain-containing protein [Clostridium tarantellae]MPQ43543.1 DUF11 domain-containing protein [Clostridium tarantellae]
MNLLYINLIKENKRNNNINLADLEVAAGTITKTVDKTQVNLQESFRYTINASFSGIQGAIALATIEDFIPDYIQYTLPPIGGLLKNKKEEDTTVNGQRGKKITFDFGSITDLGQAIALDLSCRFSFGTDNGTTFINKAILKVNSDAPIERSSPPVTLILNPDFELTKEVIIPDRVGPSVGGILIYILTLRNKLKSQGGQGDLGAKITNVRIVDTLLSGVSIDNSITSPTGTDISGYDKRTNTLTVRSTSNTVTFTLSEYFGTEYKFIYAVKVPTNFNIGDAINNRVTWTADPPTPPKPPIIVTTNVADDNYRADVIKSGPTHASAGNRISYEIFVRNSGNKDLTNVQIIDTIPEEVIVNRINIGDFCIVLVSKAFYLNSVNMTIDYEINNSGTFINLGTYATNQAQFIDLTNKVSLGQKITKIRWSLPRLPVGYSNCERLAIDGVINSNTTSQNIINKVELKADNGVNEEEYYTTIIDGLSELRIIKEEISPNTDVISGQTIRYKLRVVADKSQIDNPIITDLLDDKLEYTNNEYYKYYNYFDNENLEGNNSTFQAKGSKVIVENINNFNGTGKTLIRYKFNDGFKLEQRGNFSVEFDVKVKKGAKGEIINTGVLGNKGNKGIVDTRNILRGSKEYTDSDDRDGDGIRDETLLESNEVRNNIIITKSIASDKKVKGPLDSDFIEEPQVGNTFSGGVIEYKLTIENVGASVLNSIELIDILPRLGDTGVIDITPRNSQFTVYEVSEVTAIISPSRTPTPNLIIEYSTSNDPIRFNNTGQTIGIGNWSNIAPVPITNNRAFKITSSNLNLNQGEKLVITVKAVTPVGVTTGLVAWNSFALKGTYTENGQIQNLLPVEPEKVGVEVKEVGNGKVKIGDFVWHDLNGDGIQDIGEPGVNGVEVQLYKSDGISLGSTFTTNNFNGEPGFYLFDNLEPGNYFITFKKPNGFQFTLKDQGSDITKNSKARETSGKTENITLTAGQANLNIDAGLVKLGRVGDTVWLDLNEDGIKDINEPGISGVTVNLYDCTDTSQSTVKYSATTNLEGIYIIENVKPGSYFAVFSKPVGYRFITTRGLVDVNGKGQCFTLQSGGENLDVDAPLIDEKDVKVTKSVDKRSAEIGEELTYTITIANNGVFKVENVTLIDRLPQGTTFVQNSITVNGIVRSGITLDNNINIGDIQPNATLIVKFKVRINETGFIVSQVTNQAVITFDGGEEEPPIVVTDVVKSSIGDFVWYDLNGNGIQDNGEPGVQNVTVRLYESSNLNTPINTVITNTSGIYLFDNLKSGNYTVEFEKPDGYNFTIKDAGSDNTKNSKVIQSTGRTNNISLGKDENNLNIDAGLIDIKNVRTIKSVDKTRAELGEELTYTITITNNGIKSIKNVELIDRVPNGTTFIPNSITIDRIVKNNINLDNNLNIGEIQPNQTVIVTFKVVIKETLPIPQQVTNQAVITFDGGREEPPIVVTDVIKSSIGDFVWFDLNSNGIQDNGEPGIQNVTVRLYESNNLSRIIKTAVTGSNGEYLFDNLKSGNYTVEFVKPNGYNFTIKDAGSDNTKNSKAIQSTGRTNNISLGKNENKLNIDAGLIDIKDVKTKKTVDKATAEIGEELTYTIEIINDGVKPIRNVRLIDKIPEGTVFVSNSITIRGRRVADGDLGTGINIGEIASKEIVSVTFKVKINDSDFIPKTVSNKAIIIFDGGKEEPPIVVTDVVKSSIGDFVWHDLNGNGIQDGGEPGIQGVTVRLYQSNNLNNAIKTVITDLRGRYLFDNLKSGEYIVEFVKPNGFNFTIKNAGRDVTKNSKVIIATGRTDSISLGLAENNLTIDAGLIKPITIGDTVWLDSNKDGIQQSGEPGIENVNITLFNCNDDTRTQYSAITNNNGKYLITNVLPGSYYAIFTKPVGYEFVTVGGFVDINGQGKCFTIQSGEENLDVDAPLIDIKNITTNKTVNLANAELEDELLYTVTILNRGVLAVKNVQLKDKIPSGTTFIPGSIAVRGRVVSDVNLDSGLNIGDVNANEQVIVTFKVKIGKVLPVPNPIVNKATIIFEGGEEETPPTVTNVEKSSIGDFVWHDLNGNGIQDGGEPGVNGVTVKLYKSSDLNNAIRTEVTQANGYYLFDNLRSGEYIVEFVKLIGYNFTIKGAGVDNTKNSKVNISTGRTDNIILARGITDLTIDAGLIQPITIGDTAWLDRNEDGVQQPDEPGVGNILVTLYNCSDDSATQYTAITDRNGKYLITNVLPGRYYAIFTKPPGYNFVTVGGLVDTNGRGGCFHIQSGEQNLFVDAPLIDIKNVDVDKTVNLTTAQIGDELLYTITIINKGVAPIVNVKMLDSIPAGTIFVNGSVQVNNLSRPNDNPQNSILIGTMQPNERSTVIFKVRIGNILPNPNPIVNKARITFSGGDRETPPVTTDVVKSSIGDFVWEDLNGNGIQDGNEPGVGNIRVNLYLADNLTTSIRNTRTNLNGQYLFDNLRSGNYIVEFIKEDNTEFTIKNAGLDDNLNSKVNQLTGRTDNIDLRRNEAKLNIDAGIIKLAIVGDKAWLDLNENGIEEPGEPGVGGVKITLYDCDTETPTQYTEITDSRGMYLIRGVKPGKYYGIFVPKPGYGFVTAGNFVDENGRTKCFTINSGDKKLDVDVPLKKVPCIIETCICGKVIDKCTCLGVECIEVFLMKANVVILKTTTDCMGMYCFKITNPGMYKLVFATMCCGYYITPRILKINVECGESICDLITVVCMNKLSEKYCKTVCIEQPYCTCEKCRMRNCLT